MMLAADGGVTRWLSRWQEESRQAEPGRGPGRWRLLDIEQILRRELSVTISHPLQAPATSFSLPGLPGQGDSCKASPS